jgi:DNA polymerase III gamma/tau subunit
MRKIMQNSVYKGFFDAGDKLYLFDEFHMLSTNALNSMLKFIEEPPAHVYIVMCTAEYETIKSKKLKAAIKRRALHYELSRLRRPELLLLLKRVAKHEKFNYKKMPDRLSYIADVSDSPGQALNYLGMVLHCKTDEEAIELLQDDIPDETTVIELCRALIDHKFGATAHWERIRKLLKQLPDDPEKIRHGVLTYMEKVLMGKKHNRRAAEVADMFVTPMYHRAALVAACYWLCFGADEDIPI